MALDSRQHDAPFPQRPRAGSMIIVAAGPSALSTSRRRTGLTSYHKTFAAAAFRARGATPRRSPASNSLESDGRSPAPLPIRPACCRTSPMPLQTGNCKAGSSGPPRMPASSASPTPPTSSAARAGTKNQQREESPHFSQDRLGKFAKTGKISLRARFGIRPPLNQRLGLVGALSNSRMIAQTRSTLQ